ncbi:MAG: HD domain-containing protein [Candidatus Rokubacteria bacterium]|nr:HD domain-containing protein [Candidatus Rokubacteria bacterium]
MVRLRDLIRGDGDDEPARKRPPASSEPARPPAAPSGPPPAPREHVRFPDATGPRADGAAAPAPGAPAEDPEVVFASIHLVLGQLRDAVKGGGTLPVEDMEDVVARVILALERGSELFWLAANPAPPDTDYVAAHLASVGVLAIRIGADLGYDRGELADLGLAAFLFDIGLWQLPERVLAKGDSLTAEEQSLYHSHPRLSADIVRRSGIQREGFVEAVLEHHEREQGQGYPQGLPGSAIHPHAKIIGLMDTYTRLTAPRPPQPRLQPHEAIREIVRSKHESFPSALIKALLAEISVFPPRTMVKLNTGEVGRVVAVNRNHPLRPKVEVIVDSKGDRLHAPKLIDLSETPFLYITGPVAEAAR